MFFKFLVFGFLLFINFTVANAISITEIMYDSEGSDVDWLEIYNNESESIDVSSLKLLVSNSTANHSIKKYAGESSLASGEYGVIVVNSQITSFIEKWGSIGNIFTASFSLPNVSEDQIAKVELNAGDKNTPLASVVYEALFGAKGDGSSLQLFDGEWKSSTPTPFVENIFNSIDSEEGESEESSDNKDSDSKKSTPKKPIISAKISSPSVVFAGEPFLIKGMITENNKDAQYDGKYFWNTGDGVAVTQYGLPKKISHIYHYSGEYPLFLKYFPDVFAEDPTFEARMNIKSVPIEISIKKFENNHNDFAIEIINNSSYEMDISSWFLWSENRMFIFPKYTAILPKKSMILSGKVSGFSFIDEFSLKLYSSTGAYVIGF